MPFKSVSSFGYYHDPKLRGLITALKFNGVTVLQDDLKQFIASRSVTMPDVDAIIPMPLSEKRLKERGFNQAEVIAHAFACPVPSTPCLARSHREAQSTLEHDAVARRANVVGAFVCQGAVPPRVLLVDDVVTTGATAGEAASCLLAAGAQEVHLLTLAIGA